MSLTKADEDALKRMPDGWFDWLDLSYKIRAREYRCERLYAKGILQRRTNSGGFEYRKIQRHKPAPECAGPVGVEPQVGRPEATGETPTLVHSRALLVAPGPEVEKGGVCPFTGTTCEECPSESCFCAPIDDY